jgi:chromosome segregation ATPase
MSVDGLRVEFEAIDREMDAIRQKLAMLEQDEKSAVDRHDRAALDSAWAEHDRQLEELGALEQRREQARRDLLREAELDIERWRSKADVRVQRWREEGADVLQQLQAAIEQIERVLTELEERPERYSQERLQLLEELRELRRDFAAELPEPEIDWTVPRPDLEPFANRLAELTGRCRRTTLGDETSASRW